VGICYRTELATDEKTLFVYEADQPKGPSTITEITAWMMASLSDVLRGVVKTSHREGWGTKGPKVAFSCYGMVPKTIETGYQYGFCGIIS